MLIYLKSEDKEYNVNIVIPLIASWNGILVKSTYS